MGMVIASENTDSVMVTNVALGWQGLWVRKPPLGTICIYALTSVKEQHRQVGGIIMGTSESLCGIMVSTLAQNPRDVSSIPALGTIFLIFFITPATLGPLRGS